MYYDLQKSSILMYFSILMTIKHLIYGLIE